jgi:hypothetical protein
MVHFAAGKVVQRWTGTSLSLEKSECLVGCFTRDQYIGYVIEDASPNLLLSILIITSGGSHNVLDTYYWWGTWDSMLYLHYLI